MPDLLTKEMAAAASPFLNSKKDLHTLDDHPAQINPLKRGGKLPDKTLFHGIRNVLL
jgi:hypothetical protein